MFELLTSFTGKVVVNGKEFDSIKDADAHFKDYNGGLDIVLEPASSNIKVVDNVPNTKEKTLYKIRVKKWMTKYGKDFFLNQMNDEGPMPFVTMYGYEIQSTAKLVKMKLWAGLDNTDTDVNDVVYCMRCGRPLTNIYSKYLHLGPECGAAEHMQLLASGMSLEEVKQSFREKLHKITWTGWIVKSAILESSEVK